MDGAPWKLTVMIWFAVKGIKEHICWQKNGFIMMGNRHRLYPGILGRLWIRHQLCSLSQHTSGTVCVCFYDARNMWILAQRRAHIHTQEGKVKKRRCWVKSLIFQLETQLSSEHCSSDSFALSNWHGITLAPGSPALAAMHQRSPT